MGSEFSVALFDRWKNRGTTVDPTTGQVVPRPRPVLDAIKNMLVKGLAEAGPAFFPILLQIGMKYLNQLNGAAAAAAVEGDASLVADTLAEFSALAAAHGDVSAAVADPDWSWFEPWLLEGLSHAGPIGVYYLMEAIQKVSGGQASE